MRKTISRMIIAMLTTTSFASVDWNNFNSSLIIEVTRKTGVFTCTGVAISHDTILTAAHCLDGDVLKVRVSNHSSYDPNAKFWNAKSFELHPDYDVKTSNYRADLAKIKLTRKLPAETNIFPIIKTSKGLSGKFLRLGYGARAKQNIRTLITPEIKNINELEDILELNDMYSYSGDSGGPVFIIQKGQIYLVAIHSTLSYGPEGKYSFNPLLSSHRKWIDAADKQSINSQLAMR